MGRKLVLRLRSAGLQGTGNGLGGGVGGGGGKKIPKSAFGMHVGNLPPTTIWGDYSQTATDNYHQVPIPDMGLGSIRLWDSNGCNWRNIERTEGVFTWGRLDNAIALADQKGLDIVYNLGCGPDWATVSPGQFAGLYVGYNPQKPINDTVWINWCTAIANKLIGRGVKYEIWNEVNDQVSGSGFVGSGFIGTVADLLNLAQLAKATISAIDSTAKFLTPNFVGEAGIVSAAQGNISLDQYLAAGGAAHADIISIHGYNTLPTWTRPEGMIQMAKLCRDTLSRNNVSKPMWNTEWGYGRWRNSSGAIQNYRSDMPDQLGADYVTRMLILNWCGGFERLFFYALDGVQSYNSIVMIDPASDIGAATLKLPGYAYKYFSDLLIGGYLSDLQELVSATSTLYYSASYTTRTGRRGFIYWCDDYTSTNISIAGATGGTDNLGAQINVSSGILTVTGTPKFINFN